MCMCIPYSSYYYPVEKIPSVCNASDIIAGMPTEYDTYANLHPAVEKHTQGFHYHIH